MTKQAPLSMNELVRSWKRESGDLRKLQFNEQLLRFLGEWLYSEYQPEPEKSGFWDRLSLWLEQLPDDAKKDVDQKALFNFVPWLLFAAENDFVALYRAAYIGPICRWLIEEAGISLDASDLAGQIANARTNTWFGSLAGMDIGTFCRVNKIFGQSFRPEFRFVTEFCDVSKLKQWLDDDNYQRIVVVEDMIGTGTQLDEAMPSLEKLKSKQILIVPLFIAPAGWKVAKQIATENAHIQFKPMFILPEECLVRNAPPTGESDEIRNFREIINRRDGGCLGIDDEYGTLVLSYQNCPDNVPPIVHERTADWPNPLFPRASREG